MPLIKMEAVNSLPSSLTPDTLYFVLNGDKVEHYITTTSGILKSVTNTSVIQAIIDSLNLVGKNIELNRSATHIQWRVVGDATWINLVALADLKGDPGIQGPAGPPGGGGGGGASESVSIKDLGVEGNGTDERAAFLAAIATANGKEILVENMTIKMKPFIKSGGPNVRIKGVNSKINFIPSVSGPVDPEDLDPRFWYFGGVGKVLIHGLEFDMEGAPGDEVSGTTIVYLDNCAEVDMQYNTARDNGHAGFLPIDCDDVLISNNKFYTTDSAIFCIGQTGRAIIQNNKITGGTSEGIGVFNSGNDFLPNKWIVSGNIVHEKEGFAFNMCGSLNGELYGNVAMSCRGLVNLFDSGSGQPADRYSTFNHVHGNKVFDCEYGINNVGTGSKIDNNTFVNIDRFALGTNNYTDTVGGEDLTPSEWVDITNNHFYNICTLSGAQGGPGIWLYNLKNSRVTNNSFYGDCGAYQGMKVELAGDNLLIADNIADGLHLHPSNCDFTKKVTFRNNTFKGSHVSTPNPFTGNFGWRFENTLFAEFEVDPTSFFQDATATSGNLDTMNKDFIRDHYRVASGTTITSILKSWRNRHVRLIGKGAGFTITAGSNIKLTQSSHSIGDSQIIDLYYNGSYWGELFVAKYVSGGA